MIDFRPLWLRIGYLLGFRETPPSFHQRSANADAVVPNVGKTNSDVAVPVSHEVDEDWAGRRLLTRIICLGFGAVIFYGLFASAGRVLTPLIWALGTLALGTLTGFLFCLPRIRQGEPPDENEDAADNGGTAGAAANVAAARKLKSRRERDHYGLDINTNLEQISDWLSKIIVGLGLVELRRIPDHMVGLADYIAKDMGDPSARAFACGLVLFFSVCGFLYGYLYMRLILSNRFREADQKSKGLDRQKLDETARKTENLEELGKRRFLLLNTIHDAEIAAIQAEGPDSTPAQVDDAIRLLESARELQPDRRKTCMLLGVLYAIKKKEYDRAIRICEETIDAMRRSNSLTDKDEADFIYNIACFQIAAANELLAEDAQKAVRVNKSLQTLERAVKKWPALKELARSDKQKEWNQVRDNQEFQRILAE